MPEEDRRKVRDTEEVTRKDKAVQGKSSSQGRGGGHCHITVLTMLSCPNLRSKSPGKDTLMH